VYEFAAFEQVFIAHIRALVHSFIVKWYAAFEWGTIGDVPCAKMLWGVQFVCFISEIEFLALMTWCPFCYMLRQFYVAPSIS
jgi:hypothetical protein